MNIVNVETELNALRALQAKHASKPFLVDLCENQIDKLKNKLVAKCSMQETESTINNLLSI